MMHRFAFAVLIVIAVPSQAQRADASLDQLAATPVVTVHISEQLRAPPDEATLTISTESREATASAALASNKLKTEQLVAAIRNSGVGAKDSQTEGVSVRAEYRYDNVNGRGQQHLIGYVARNSVRIKTRHIDEVAALLDAMTAAGATEVYGPQFSIADPAPLRAEARRRAMTRGQAEAAEYARNAGFARVRLLSVEEGTSYHADDIVVTGSRIVAPMAPPPPPPPAIGGGSIQPGQIETGVSLTLQYRMER